MAPHDSSTTVAAPNELAPGFAGIAEDWASDQRTFKNVPWGKAMMWIFLLSDTFIFSSFLVGYMKVRLSTTTPWPNPSEVFALSFGGEPIPLILIAIMTFILITSSGTMVLAVNYGYGKHKPCPCFGCLFPPSAGVAESAGFDDYAARLTWTRTMVSLQCNVRSFFRVMRHLQALERALLGSTQTSIQKSTAKEQLDDPTPLVYCPDDRRFSRRHTCDWRGSFLDDWRRLFANGQSDKSGEERLDVSVHGG